MGKYYDHPSELKHMILDQISRSNGLTGAEVEGIRTWVKNSRRTGNVPRAGQKV